MEFLEKNLEDIIFETANNELNNRGLYIFGKKFRQLKIGNYGVCDIMTCDINREPDGCCNNDGNCNECKGKVCIKVKGIDIKVLELKQSKIGVSAFLQGIRYCKGVLDYLEKRKFDLDKIRLNLILIGRDIDKSSDFIYISDVINQYGSGYSFDLEYYLYKYEFDGIKFEQISGYSLINKGF
jgi:hypothetical protein